VVRFRHWRGLLFCAGTAGLRARILPFLDGGDQLALAHPANAGDTERLRHLLELGHQHRGQTGSCPATLLGVVREFSRSRRRIAHPVRRRAGGVAQWIPSLAELRSEFEELPRLSNSRNADVLVCVPPSLRPPLVTM
jgi:hypothetical protein